MISIMLDQVMQEKDVSARELHRRCGVHRSTIQKWRHNETKVLRLSILERLTAALHVPITDVLRETPHTHTHTHIHVPLNVPLNVPLHGVHPAGTRV